MSNEKELLFKAQIAENQNNFNKKGELTTFFRLHKEISETALRLTRTDNSVGTNIIFTLLVDEYDRVAQELRSRSKTYEQLYNEKIFVDIYSAFEKLLYGHLHTLYSLFPKICFSEPRLHVRFTDIFLSESLKNSQEYIIEETIKSIIQSSTIDKTIEILLEKSQIKKKDQNIFNDDEKKALLRFSKIRNLIIHNESLMNKLVLEEFHKLGIAHDYAENQLISENLDNDISQMQELFHRKSQAITSALNSKAIQLVRYDAST